MILSVLAISWKSKKMILSSQCTIHISLRRPKEIHIGSLAIENISVVEGKIKLSQSRWKI